MLFKLGLILPFSIFAMVDWEIPVFLLKSICVKFTAFLASTICSKKSARSLIISNSSAV